MTDPSPSQRIDHKIAGLADWRGLILAQVRATILSADENILETVKWMKPTNPLGVPVWECSGILCTGETYKDKIKLTFAHGAALPDPSHVFNAGLDGGTRRAIDYFQGDNVDTAALDILVRDAIAFNRAKAKNKK